MRPRKSFWFARITALIVVGLFFVWPLVAGAIVVVWLIYRLGKATYYQGYQAPSLERGLGFRHGKEYRQAGWLPESSLAITSIVDGGVFQSVGFRVNDVVPDFSFTEFFRHLHIHRGQNIELDVVDGGEGPPFESRPRRTIAFSVPAYRESPPTRRDALAAVSIWFPILLMPVGAVAGYLICQITIPGVSLWVQAIVVYCVISVGCYWGICATVRLNNRESSTDG
ncbi:MAG: hypothetical protein HY290_15265 [Planctomycetia bacterium]|nr:hypothetical protein [Planctomycetia bacterium]